MALSNKQRAFVDEYLKSKNATRAAILAGYSPHSASAIGWENLRKPEIAEVIKQRFSENAMSADEVLSRLADQARGCVADFLTFYPHLPMPVIDLTKANEAGKMHLIKKLKFSDSGGVEFELYDAQAALALLAKSHRLLVDKAEVTGKDDGPVELVVTYVNKRGD